MAMPRRPVRRECGRRMSRRDHAAVSVVRPGQPRPPAGRLGGHATCGPRRQRRRPWNRSLGAGLDATVVLEHHAQGPGRHRRRRASCAGPGRRTCPPSESEAATGIAELHPASPLYSATSPLSLRTTSRRRRPRHRRHTRSSSSTPRCTHRCHRRHGPTAPCGSARVRPTAPSTRARRTGVLPSTERPRSNARADSDGSPRAKSM